MKKNLAESPTYDLKANGNELTNERTQIKYVWGKAGLMKEGVQDFLDRIKSAPIAEGNVK